MSDCMRCKGSGSIIVDTRDDGVNVLENCPDCEGTGELDPLSDTDCKVVDRDKIEAQREDAWDAARELRLMDAWDKKMQAKMEADHE